MASGRCADVGALSRLDQAPSPCERSVWGPVYAQLLREWIEAGESVCLPLTGESMAPSLHGGANVFLAHAAPAQISCGDLVVYQAEGRLICHRVLRRRVRRGRYAFLTKGDHWRTTGSWIRDRQIIGTLIAVEQDGRLRRLDAPLRRWLASGVAGLSLMAAGSVMVVRWGKQMLRGQWRRARSA